MAAWAAEAGDPAWVAAVSGGGDSVAMLRVLHGLAGELGIRLIVAHLDHGARGASSREDARFVADLASSLDLPFELGAWSASRPGHFEADARAARLAWLTEVARKHGASAVATGHTKDDQAETILHRIVRGTGLRGLAGIPATRPLAPGLILVRPLLDVSRRQLREELARLGQGFREDATNADVSRTRARIRHDLLPRLEADFNPQIVAALARLGELAGEDRRVFDAVVAAAAGRIVRSIAPSRIVLERSMIAVEDPALVAEVIRRSWRRAGWPERAMTARRWRRLAEGRHGEDVGGGVSLRIEADAFILIRRTSPSLPCPAVAPLPLEAPGDIDVPWADAHLEASAATSLDDFDEVIDGDRVGFPLVVRPPAPGDRFDPLGMGGRRQRLVEFLRLRGVPSDARANVPIVADAAGIVWVVGHRIAERVRTTERTTRRLGLRWRRVVSEVDGSGGLV